MAKVRSKYARQTIWQVKTYRAGKCIWCAKKREDSPFKRLCRECGEKRRATNRARRGSVPWKKGVAGRPPAEYSQQFLSGS